MTTTNPNARTPNFPAHPHDGYQITQDLPDGGYAVWTYSEQFNQWTCQILREQRSDFIYTSQVLTTPTEVETAEGGKEVLQTQEQVNNFIADVSVARKVEAMEARLKELEARLGNE